MKPQEISCLRAKRAAEILGIGESTLWRWVKETPDFPQPIRLGSRVTVWRTADLLAWRDARIHEVRHAHVE
jgi:prophage regulatory protein